jgi:hypothetical protein
MGGFVATTKAASFLEKTISAYKADDQNFDRLKLSTKEWRIGESEKSSGNKLTYTATHLPINSFPLPLSLSLSHISPPDQTKGNTKALDLFLLLLIQNQY